MASAAKQSLQRYNFMRHFNRELVSHVDATRQSSQPLDAPGAAALPGLYAVADHLVVPEHYADPGQSFDTTSAGHPCPGDPTQLHRYLQAGGLRRGERALNFRPGAAQ